MSVKVYWTKASYDCYNQNCECSNKCPNYAICQKVAKEQKDGIPPMKKCVSELLDKGYCIPLSVTDSVLNTLSESETTIFRRWVIDGMSTVEIAKDLKLTEHAVRNCKSRIYCRLNYQFPSQRGRSDFGKKFTQWAKENLVEELYKLEKEGVKC